MVKLFKLNRRLSVKDHLNIIYSAYGSLTDFSAPRKKLALIAEELKLPMREASRFLKRLRDNNFELGALLQRRRAPGKARKCPPTLERELIVEKTLQSMCHLSLRKRCSLVQKRYGLSMCPATLMLIYRRNGIRYSLTGKSFYGEGVRPEELRSEREAFALQVS